MGIFSVLKERGLIAQMTDEEQIQKLLENEKVTFYIGFDATADSLHVGHFLQLVVMSHMQKAGHKPIILLGTGTTMVGDPTGKTDMRKMLDENEIDHNAECFKKQMSRFIDFSDDKVIIVKNGDWLKEIKYIEFLRDVGVHFSVNKMLTAECFKSRLESKGLSFLEFNYMLMQSYDFLKLFDDYNCKMELGGNDQWANIISGVDLVRRVRQKEVYGMTFTLLTTKEGKKMGKTENGAVWLDAEKTSPYDFFQYWRNIPDDDVINCMKMITFVPMNEILEMEKLMVSDPNNVKKRLAFELTKMVHGETEAEKASTAAQALFTSGGNTENMPFTKLENSDFTESQINILDVLIKTGIAKSKGEGRRLIEQGGISVCNSKVTDASFCIPKTQIKEETVIIRKGKKIFHKIVV